MKLFIPPKKIALVSGASEGETELNAFDNALLEAGIGNFNLIKVSSILPKNCNICKKEDISELETGSFVPSVIAKKISTRKGETINSSIAIARTESGWGFLIEKTDTGKKDPENDIELMAKEMAEKRREKIKEIIFSSKAHKVEKVGCVVSCAVFIE